MSWKIPKVWENEEVWILGGGPSVASSFNIPEEVVKEVETAARGRVKELVEEKAKQIVSVRFDNAHIRSILSR